MTYIKHTREEALELWLAALRDPDAEPNYPDGQTLEDPEDSNCLSCLGHLCRALGVPREKGTILERQVFRAGGEERLLFEEEWEVVLYDGEMEQLPREVAAFMGITPEGMFKQPVYADSEGEGALDEDLPDEAILPYDSLQDLGYSEFTLVEIAQVIEELWEDGFVKYPRDASPE